MPNNCDLSSALEELSKIGLYSKENDAFRDIIVEISKSNKTHPLSKSNDLEFIKSRTISEIDNSFESIDGINSSLKKSIENKIDSLKTSILKDFNSIEKYRKENIYLHYKRSSIKYLRSILKKTKSDREKHGKHYLKLKKNNDIAVKRNIELSKDLLILEKELNRENSKIDANNKRGVKSYYEKLNELTNKINEIKEEIHKNDEHINRFNIYDKNDIDLKYSEKIKDLEYKIGTLSENTTGDKSSHAENVLNTIKSKILNVFKYIREKIKNISKKREDVRYLESLIDKLENGQNLLDIDNDRLKLEFKITSGEYIDDTVKESYDKLTNSNENIKNIVEIKSTPLTKAIDIMIRMRDKGTKEVFSTISRLQGHNVNIGKISSDDIDILSNISRKIGFSTLDINKAVGSTKIKEDTSIDSGNNVFYVLNDIFKTENGLLGKTQMMAIAIGVSDAISNWSIRANNLRRKDVDQLSKDTGISLEDAMILKSHLESGKIPTRLMIKETSQLVMDSIGISVKKDVDHKTKDIIESGIEALILAQLKSFIGKQNKSSMSTEVVDIGTKKYTMISLNEKYIEDILGYKINDISKSIRNFSYIDENRLKNTVSLEPVKSRDKIKNSYLKMNQDDKDVSNRAGSIPYRIDTEEVTKIQEVYNRSENDKMSILKSFGYVDLKTLPQYKRNAQKSKNLSIERELEILFEHNNVFGDKEIYLPHTTTKSRRNDVASELNPVNSKIHREFIHKEVYVETIDLREPQREVNDVYKNNELNNQESLEIALSQAFDQDPDKKTIIATLNDLRELIDIYSDNVFTPVGSKKMPMTHKFVTSKDNDYSLLEEAFNIGGVHAVRGAITLRDLYRAKNNNQSTFTHKLTFELDAITSGTALLSLQAISNKNKELLSKAGIFIGEEKDRWESYVKKVLSHKYKDMSPDDFRLDAGALIEAGKYHTSLVEKEDNSSAKYKELFGEEQFRDIYTVVGAETYAKAIQSLKDKYSKPEQKDILDKEIEFVNYVFGVKDGVFADKDGRKISKSPVMVFNYGSLMYSIKKKLSLELVGEKFKEEIFGDNLLIGNEIVSRVIKEMYPDKTKEKTKTEEQYLDDFFNDVSNFEYEDKDGNIVQFRTKEDIDRFNSMSFHQKRRLVSSKFSDDKIKALIKVSNGAIGDHIENVMSEKFEDIETYRNFMKKSEYIISSIFRLILKKEFENHIEKNNVLTKDDIYNIIQKLDDNGLGHSIKVGRGLQTFLKQESSQSDNDSVNVYLTDGSQASSSIKELNFVSNSGAFATITIHSIDDNIIQEAIKNNDFSSIYDAIIVGSNYSNILESSEGYNTRLIDSANEIRLTNITAEKLNRMLDVSHLEYNITEEDIENEINPFYRQEIIEGIDYASHSKTKMFSRSVSTKFIGHNIELLSNDSIHYKIHKNNDKVEYFDINIVDTANNKIKARITGHLNKNGKYRIEYITNQNDFFYSTKKSKTIVGKPQKGYKFTVDSIDNLDIEYTNNFYVINKISNELKKIYDNQELKSNHRNSISTKNKIDYNNLPNVNKRKVVLKEKDDEHHKSGAFVDIHGAESDYIYSSAIIKRNKNDFFGDNDSVKTFSNHLAIAGSNIIENELKKENFKDFYVNYEISETIDNIISFVDSTVIEEFESYLQEKIGKLKSKKIKFTEDDKNILNDMLYFINNITDSSFGLGYISDKLSEYENVSKEVHNIIVGYKGFSKINQKVYYESRINDINKDVSDKINTKDITEEC